MKIYYSSECLSYQQPGHPESPERIRKVAEYLARMGFAFFTPTRCTEADILRVHSKEHLFRIKTETFFDIDTPTLPNIYEYARLSAGSAILASESATLKETAFSLMRPPGHHASHDRVMGFCYLNNIAIASAHYLHKHPDGRVGILDIDVHHGNGTEAIFKGNKSVFFISLHQSPLYPGTGLKSNGNSVNIPITPGADENNYLKNLEIACDKLLEFEPSLIAVSAGFDTFQEDPLANINLETGTYKKIAEQIVKLKRPTFIVMEGGYSPGLARCVFEFIHPFC
jgi:acetoin utilization deacetylase AcuC-like enzyme